MAVGLTRWRGRDDARGGLVERALELSGRLVDVQRARERALRIERLVAQAGEAVQQNVDLELRALRMVVDPAAPQQPLELGRRGVDEDVVGAQLVLGGAVGEADVDATGVGLERDDLGVRPSVAPAARATRASASETTPIPPTGTSQSPVPPPITWYRKQRFWRRSSPWACANVPINASVSTTPATTSSLTRPVDRITDRRFEQRVVRRVVGDQGADLVARSQRFGQRGKQRARHARGRGIEAGERGELAVGARDALKRGACRRGVCVVDEQPARRVARVGRVRGDRSPGQAQLTLEAEVAHDLRRAAG